MRAINEERITEKGSDKETMRECERGRGIDKPRQIGKHRELCKQSNISWKRKDWGKHENTCTKQYVYEKEEK